VQNWVKGRLFGLLDHNKIIIRINKIEIKIRIKRRRIQKNLRKMKIKRKIIKVFGKINEYENILYNFVES
jgi:hypothetical protein